MHQSLVGVHHLLHVWCFVAVVGEGSILIEVFIGINDILYRCLGLDDCGAEDASGEVAAIGDEVDVSIEITLDLLQRLTNLSDVLVLEGLINAQVVVAP